MKIGIISDVHRNPERVSYGVRKLKDLGVERLVLNGDIGEAGNVQESQEYTARILEPVIRSGLETYIQPGSHETLSGFGVVVDTLSQKHNSLVNMLHTPFVDFAGYRLAFLPGSDVHSGGEYHLQAELPSGQYAVLKEGLVPLESPAALESFAREKRLKGVLHNTKMYDLAAFVENPQKTIVVCHIPACFPIGPKGVDFAYFATNADGELIPGMALEQGIRRQIKEKNGRDISAQDLERIAETYGFIFHKRNVGNKNLRKLFDELGIKYAINGHIHESGHHAHNKKGNAVPEYTPHQELFWNSGCLDQEQMGILFLGDSGVAYQNVKL